MKAGLFLFSFTFLLLVGAMPAQSPKEKRLALVMGVWDYKGEVLRPLASVDKDVAAMSKQLQEAGFQVTAATNPSLAEAQKSIDEFTRKLHGARQGGRAVGLFYFSGTGFTSGGATYLLPKDAGQSGPLNVETMGFAAESVLARMSESGDGVNLMFVDSCRTESKSTETKSTTVTGDCFVGYATAVGKVALESSKGGLYTTALCQQIGRKGISIFEAHTLAVKEVQSAGKAMGSSQVPTMYSTLEAPFYFVPEVKPSAASP